MSDSTEPDIDDYIMAISASASKGARTSNKRKRVHFNVVDDLLEFLTNETCKNIHKQDAMQVPTQTQDGITAGKVRKHVRDQPKPKKRVKKTIMVAEERELLPYDKERDFWDFIITTESNNANEASLLDAYTLMSMPLTRAAQPQSETPMPISLQLSETGQRRPLTRAMQAF